jgi:hypothetical protein
MAKSAEKNNDLKISLFVKEKPEKVYEKINNVAGWWIGDVKGTANKKGDKFTYSYKTFHDTTQKVTELIPNKRVVWNVTDSKINFVKNKEEWQDTNIIFDLIPKEGGTEILFTHQGLTPAIECYNDCSGGWDFYINKSLKNYILKGKGIDPGF